MPYGIQIGTFAIHLYDIILMIGSLAATFLAQKELIWRIVVIREPGWRNA